MLSRRTFLLTAGASTIAVTADAEAFGIFSSDLGKARRPWVEAGGSFGDPRLDALAYAVLAPNPHNRQPWLAQLEGGQGLSLYCDLERLLPETDPPNRQVVIGLGAFVELLRQAAAAQGWRLDITSFPEGEPYPVLDERPVAHITFIRDESVQHDPLFGAALDRRTVRTPFSKKREVSVEALQHISATLRPEQGGFAWTNDAVALDDLKAICCNAWRIEATTPRTHHESVTLMRIGEREINANPDGISVFGPMISILKGIGLLNRERLSDPSSRAFKGALEMYEKGIDSAMAFGWLSTKGNTRKDQFNAGAGWIRLNLAATQAGLAMQPLSQALQEFPEMAEAYREFHDYVGLAAPARVQGLFRFGYAKSPAPSPRWPVSTRIIEA